MHHRRSASLAAALLILLLLLPSGCGPLKRWGYSGSNRDEWQKPDEVIAALEIQPGDRIADIGAGGGYFTWRLAEATGPTGVTYAIDVDTDMTEYLEEETVDRGTENVVVILGEFDDPLIPEPGVDLVFTSNTYHHIQNRPAYFANLRRSLRPGGRVAILELNGTSFFERWGGHFTPRQTILSEMVDAGYKPDKAHNFVERQHFLVFSVAASAATD